MFQLLMILLIPLAGANKHSRHGNEDEGVEVAHEDAAEDYVGKLSSGRLNHRTFVVLDENA